MEMDLGDSDHLPGQMPSLSAWLAMHCGTLGILLALLPLLLPLSPCTTPPARHSSASMSSDVTASVVQGVTERAVTLDSKGVVLKDPHQRVYISVKKQTREYRPLWDPGGQSYLQRIIGGYIVAPYSSKYLVSLKRNSGFHFCGGSLVSRRWVVTAAHCRTELGQMLIVAGEYSLSNFEGTEQIFRPAVMVVHPDYNATSRNADIMLIKLSRLVIYNGFVSIISVAMEGASVASGRYCQVFGWGYTSTSGGTLSDTPRSVKLPVVSMDRCNGTSSYSGRITSNMFCAGFSSGGKDACQGDSGGPLMCDGRLFGIVSWGNGCANPNFPGVYTAVANFQKWVYRTILE